MIEALEKLFIRPSRHNYAIKDLGAPRFLIGDKQVTRQDFSLRNKLGKRIEASCFLFQQLEQTEEIVLYLHCNSGSRVEGIAHAKQILDAGLAFMVFDFCGSGLSEGEYVTLGLNEAEDLEAVVSHLKGLNQNIKIVLWGRSMGAVASLLFLYKHHEDVSVVVLDSPFFSLRELALDIGNSQTSLPKFMLEGFIRILNNHLKQRTKLDLINKLSLNSISDSIPTPALFLGSKSDSLVPFKHIETLYSSYSGYKQIYYLDQDHHQRRSVETVSFVLKFITRHLHAPQKSHKKTISNFSGLHKNKPKHSVSQFDFRISLEPCKKIDLITKSARRKQQQTRPSKPIIQSVKYNLIENAKHHQSCLAKVTTSKKKFIHLVDKSRMSNLEAARYSSQSTKLIRNQTELFRLSHNNSKRQPIHLCKNSTQKSRTPLKDITLL